MMYRRIFFRASRSDIFSGTEGLDYQVAVTTGGNMGGPLYSSDAGFGNAEIADADGTMNIFGRHAQRRTRISDSYFPYAVAGKRSGGFGRGHVVSAFARCGRGPGLALDREASPREERSVRSLRIRAAAIWRSALACSSCW